MVAVGLSRFWPFGIAPVWLDASMATPQGHSGEPCAGDLTVTLGELGAYIDRACVSDKIKSDHPAPGQGSARGR